MSEVTQREGQATVASICEALLRLEREHELFEWRVEGVYVWPLMRMPLYYSITKRLGVFGAPHGSSKWKGRAWSRSRLWLRAAGSLLTRRRRPTEVLIFDHPRKVKRGERSVDLYTEAIIEQLQARGAALEVYENLSYLNTQLEERDHPRRYYDLIATMAKLGAALSKPRLSQADLSLINSLERSLSETLGLTAELGLQRLTQRVTREFQLRRRAYLRLLQAHRPKALIVVVSYSHSIAPLIDAARALQIPTVEMQHGTFSAYHLGYHFPKLSRHPYFCDSLFTFGAFWSQMAALPIPPLPRRGTTRTPWRAARESSESGP